ncbi:P-loop NTPase fold protein [Streptococcus uberis]|uniref:P-loop NTPase fold protein n=1 Tax=Streptococcus uberis TaxID=1349 RepID=UPI001EEFE821|nr:P-loop NTPase fold protein [Streptococcus uberis]
MMSKKYVTFQWFSSLIVIGWWMIMIDLFPINHQAFKKLYYSIFQNNPFFYIIFQSIYRYRTITLIIATILVLIYYVCCFGGKKVFEELNKEKFKQYSNKEYHTQLVHFLNKDIEKDSNIFWLDGKWGSGKTKFLNTFFENQEFEINNIYKVSCFGLKTREQVENNLREQIDMKSPFILLQKFPFIGELLIYISQTIGINKIKKNSIIIFDDLERVSVYFPEYNLNKKNEQIFVEDKESTQSFNNILGYIDYIAENFPVKIIVLLNKSEIPKTEIIWSKFKTGFYQFENWSEILDSLLSESLQKNSFEFNFLKNYYMFILLNTEKLNYRLVKNDISELIRASKSDSSLQSCILKMLHNYKNILTKWPKFREDSSEYNFFEIYDEPYNLPEFLTEEEEEELIGSINKKHFYFIKIFETLWNWENDSGNKVFPKILLQLEDREDYLLLDQYSNYERQLEDDKLDYEYVLSSSSMKNEQVEEINHRFDSLIKKYEVVTEN